MALERGQPLPLSALSSGSAARGLALTVMHGGLEEAVAALNPEDSVYNELEPGMASVHHFRLAHRSGANTTDGRRIGFVVRCIATHVSSETAESGQMTLVRGVDRHGNFQKRERIPLSWYVKRRERDPSEEDAGD